MANVNERQISLRKGGNFSTLDLYLDRHTVHEVDEQASADQEFTLGSTSDVVAITNMTTFVPSVYRYYLTPSTPPTPSSGELASLDRGVPAANVATIGTNSFTAFVQDSAGNIINLVNIVDALTGVAITAISGKQVYGLMQTTETNGGTVTTGNAQISFVEHDGAPFVDSSLPAGTYKFTYMVSRKNRFDYAIQLERSSDTSMLGSSGTIFTRYWHEYTITARSTSGNTNLTFGANTTTAPTLTNSAAATANSNANLPAGNILVNLGASSTIFNSDPKVRIFKNGVQQEKGADVTWVSATAAQFAQILDAGDVIRFEQDLSV